MKAPRGFLKTLGGPMSFFKYSNGPESGSCQYTFYQEKELQNNAEASRGLDDGGEAGAAAVDARTSASGIRFLCKIRWRAIKFL